MSKSKAQEKNMINSLMNFLPDSRPITSLHILENFDRCPPNFQSVHRTHDQDSDADLWRDNNIFFSKTTRRYLCISKSEGLPEYIVETLRIIGEKENPPEGFSLLTRTADTEQKAWRKKQIAYKLAKRSIAKNAVTDIILCARVKNSPEGFQTAGDINGILVCFKSENLQHRAPPAIPTRPAIPNYDNIGNDLQNLNLNQKSPLYPLPNIAQHDYEQLNTSYQISPKRPAPRPPTSSTNTLGGIHCEIEGVPFILNPNLNKQNFELPKLNLTSSAVILDYDFHLERQVLCTTKTNAGANKNPFFH